MLKSRSGREVERSCDPQTAGGSEREDNAQRRRAAFWAQRSCLKQALERQHPEHPHSALQGASFCFIYVFDPGRVLKNHRVAELLERVTTPDFTLVFDILAVNPAFNG